MRVSVLGFVVVAIAGSLFGACGSSSSSSSSSSTSSGGPDGGADVAPTPTGKMTIAVVAPPLDGTFPDPLPPAPLANVAVDLPGGEHRDLVAGPDGKLTIDGIDWSKGTAGIVAYTAGKHPYAVANIGPDTFAKIPHGRTGGVDVGLYMFPIQSKQYSVNLGVTFTNPEPATNEFFYSSTNCSQIVDVKASKSNLFVKPDVPIDIILRQDVFTMDAAARSYTSTGSKWSRFELPAEPAAGAPVRSVTLDCATAPTLTPQTITGHIAITGGDSGPLGGKSTGVVFVLAKEGFNHAIGIQSKIGPSTDKSAFDYTLEVVTVPGRTPDTGWGINLPDGGFSRISRAGLPTEGETITGLPTPPTLPTGTVSLKGPVATAGIDAAAVVRLIVTDSAGSYQLLVDAPPGTTWMKVPAIPAGARPTASVQAQLVSLSGNDDAVGLYRKAAGTATFDVAF